MKTLPIECILSTTSEVSAKIKRFDGLYYNVSTKNFEDNPDLKIILQKNQDDIYSLENPINITPTQFVDGRYTIYYYDGDKVAGATYEEVEAGVVLTVNALTDVAIRIANIRTIDGSLKKTLDKLSKQMNEVLTLLKSGS